MDRFIGLLHVAILRSPALLFHGPERVHAPHLRQMGEIPRRRRGRGRPFERTTVPRIPRHIAIKFAPANTHGELHASQCYTEEDQQGARQCDEHERLPMHVRIVLHAPRRAHEAQCVKRREGEVEAEEPAPETALPSRSFSVKPKAFGNHTVARAGLDPA